VVVTPLTPVSVISASDLVSSKSGMIVLASRGISLTENIVNTWSVLENAEKPVLGVILSDSTI
jgi:hypothetical protein